MFVELNDFRIYLDVYGVENPEKNGFPADKPVLFAVMGGPGISHKYLKPSLNPLADEMVVVYVDLRGVGQSQYENLSNINRRQWAQDLIDLFDHLKIKKPFVFAHSSAPHIIASLAQLEPTRLSGAVLSSPMIIPRVAIANYLADRGKKEEADIAREFWQHPSADKVQFYMERVFPEYNPAGITAQLIPRVELNLDVFFSTFDEHFSCDLSKDLIGVKFPIDILLGKQDPFNYPFEKVLETVKQLDNEQMSYEIFNHSGHDLLMSEQDAVLAEVRQFIGNLAN